MGAVKLERKAEKQIILLFWAAENRVGFQTECAGKPVEGIIQE